ncbi:MAG: dTMP kinase [Anaerolineae bacterium]|nr:MAG: dTMP kinase [Anaerolineae bacterium]
MFITFEGPEGSGKTTQVPLLADFLRRQGYDVLTTREPGGTPIGDQIRAVLSDLENTAMHPRTEILLFLASRAQLVEQVIRPHLARGGIVLCDRYADSTLAYQGYGHGVNLDVLQNLLLFATDGVFPHLTFLLDLDVEVGLERRARGGDWNRLDAYALEFHRRVRMGYHALARQDAGRWVIVDASRSPEQVQQDIRAAVTERLASVEIARDSNG